MDLFRPVAAIFESKATILLVEIAHSLTVILRLGGR